MSSLRYAVRIDEPTRHTAEVTLRFEPTAEVTDVTLPAWCPGSYLIRDYARLVRDLSATDAGGAPLAARKIDKSTWRIATGAASEVCVRYGLYAHDLTVRTNHIDASHAFLHGPATFLFPTTHRAIPCEVVLEGPAGWQLTTALAWPPAPGAPLRTDGIDALYDHPIHLAAPGAVREFAVEAVVPVRLVVWGERAPGGAFGEARLAEDLAAVVAAHIARMGGAGEVPFPHYTFLLFLTHEGYGGLEHRASSVNMFHPHFGATRKAYEGLLELLSHELFHAWNGKRIAPAPLLEVDYAREAYTPCLWLMEGLTSYYDRRTLRSAGRITARAYLEKVLDDWTRLMATPGRARQSLEASSFDAWIKLYRPDESNLNTTVSYYLKGGLVMLALDLQIRRRTEGALSLDDVLRAVWQQFGARGVPHPDDLQPVFEAAVGLDLGEVFATQVRGTADPALALELRHVGLELRASWDPGQVADGASAVWLGALVSGTRVTAVFDGSPAQAGGLSPGDEVIALDRFRITGDGELRSQLAVRAVGERVTVSVFRRHRLVELTCVLAPAPPTRYEIAGIAEAGAAAARYQAWLGDPHPGSGVVATITTTARWV